MWFYSTKSNDNDKFNAHRDGTHQHMVFTSSLRDASTDHRVNAFTRLTPVYLHNTVALQAGVFGSKSRSLTRSTYDAMKWEHRQLHEPLVRPSNFTGSGCLITILPTLMPMVESDGHATAMRGTRWTSAFSAASYMPSGTSTSPNPTGQHDFLF